MDLQAFDRDSNLDAGSTAAPASPSGARPPQSPSLRLVRSAPPRSAVAKQSVSTLTNSPGCAPRGHSMRSVRASSAAANAAPAVWTQPSRSLRKISLRAVDGDWLEPA